MLKIATYLHWSSSNKVLSCIQGIQGSKVKHWWLAPYLTKVTCFSTGVRMMLDILDMLDRWYITISWSWMNIMDAYHGCLSLMLLDLVYKFRRRPCPVQIKITAGLGGCNVAVEEHHRFLENAVIQIVQGAYLATATGDRIPAKSPGFLPPSTRHESSHPESAWEIHRREFCLSSGVRHSSMSCDIARQMEKYINWSYKLRPVMFVRWYPYLIVDDISLNR